jgi:predicted kinase
MSSPCLILVSGPPAAGKSTLSMGLAAHTGAICLDKDCIDDGFHPQDRGEHYTREVEPKVLTALLNLARLNLNIGNHVITDVPWSHIMLNTPEWIDRIENLCEETNAQLIVFECVLSEKKLKERMRERNLDRDQFRTSDEGWETFKKTDRIGELNPMPHTIIDMEKDPESCLKNALDHMGLDVEKE